MRGNQRCRYREGGMLLAPGDTRRVHPSGGYRHATWHPFSPTLPPSFHVPSGDAFERNRFNLPVYVIKEFDG